ADPSGRRGAEDGVEQGGGAGVRVLLERQPGGQSPALEPGDGAPDRRVSAAPHAHVQRLRRPGGPSLRGDGPKEALLAAVPRRARLALKALVWAACLAPLSWLVYRFATDDLTANPISFVTNTLGDWTLRLLLASLVITPLRYVCVLSCPNEHRLLLALS